MSKNEQKKNELIDLLNVIMQDCGCHKGKLSNKPICDEIYKAIELATYIEVDTTEQIP